MRVMRGQVELAGANQDFHAIRIGKTDRRHFHREIGPPQNGRGRANGLDACLGRENL